MTISSIDSIRVVNISENSKTQQGVQSDKDFEGIISDLEIKQGTKKNLFEKLKNLQQSLGDVEVIEYFYEAYYLRELSFRDISQELKNQYDFDIGLRTIARWFQVYFSWQARDSNTEITLRTLQKQSKGLEGNTNGVIVHERARALTHSYVNDILKGLQIEVQKENFDTQKYYSYKRPIDKLRYLLRFSGFGEHPIQSLINTHSKLGIGNQAIATIINTTAQALVTRLNLSIQVPILSKQTIYQRTRKK